jgi:hypothetical protein
VRAVPTGPLAPLVVAVTTSDGCLVLGFSYRTAAFTRGDIDKIGTSLLHGIAGLS